MKSVECVNITQENGHAVLSLDGAEYAVSLTDLQKITGDLFGHVARPLLRPSALPKLAECPCYVSCPAAGDAAIRGTKMDMAFRELLQGRDEFQALQHLEPDAKEGVTWAVNTVRLLCRDAEIIADKQRCAFPQWHERVTGGEADAICPTRGKLFDLKSGQIRNYWEQQACYAKAIMDAEFLDELDCYLLFCDQQQIVSRKFTYQEAIDMVNAVVKSVDNGAEPRINDYCTWCAKEDTCPLRNKSAQELAAMVDSGTLDTTFAQIAEDPARLAEFVTKAGVLEAYAKKGKEHILEFLNNGVEVPGYKRVSRKGTDTIAPESVAKYANWIGASSIIKAYGPMKADTFRKLFADAMPNDQFPEDIIITGAGSCYVKRVSTKKQ